MSEALAAWDGYAYDVPSGPRAEASQEEMFIPTPPIENHGLRHSSRDSGNEHLRSQR